MQPVVAYAVVPFAAAAAAVELHRAGGGRGTVDGVPPWRTNGRHRRSTKGTIGRTGKWEFINRVIGLKVGTNLDGFNPLLECLDRGWGKNGLNSKEY